jgi:UDP-N-acetylglucosamine 2-epimerase (non-hydrolysing)
MKVITIIGTRPEIIRTSCICPKLDELCKHIIVHTNQNFTKNLKDLFFEEMELRRPNIVLKSSMEEGWKGSSHTTYGLGRQLADMFPQIEDVFHQEKPDKVFILGDTNSALCSIIAERMGIPVYHMEAANRSFNREIPEEVNRRLIDSISSYNLFYTNTNRHTLLREGMDPKKIFQCGNPTLEVLTRYEDKIADMVFPRKSGHKVKLR